MNEKTLLNHLRGFRITQSHEKMISMYKWHAFASANGNFENEVLEFIKNNEKIIFEEE